MVVVSRSLADYCCHCSPSFTAFSMASFRVKTPAYLSDHIWDCQSMHSYIIRSSFREHQCMNPFPSFHPFLGPSIVRKPPANPSDSYLGVHHCATHFQIHNVNSVPDPIPDSLHNVLLLYPFQDLLRNVVYFHLLVPFS
jgi:hypothetical protein